MCGTTLCGAMSEGWGDFIALHADRARGRQPRRRVPVQRVHDAELRRRPGVLRHPPRAVQRRTRRSTRCRSATWPTASRCRRPIRSCAFGNNSEVHNAGEVWAATLWEVYVALQKAGHVVRRQSARKMAELRRRRPAAGARRTRTPTETRDAILAAALAASPADHDDARRRSRAAASAAARCRRPRRQHRLRRHRREHGRRRPRGRRCVARSLARRRLRRRRRPRHRRDARSSRCRSRTTATRRSRT